VTLTATTGFDTVIVSADSTATAARLGAMIVAPTFTTLRLTSTTTNLTLTIGTPPAGTTPQFAARLGAGPVGNYVSVPTGSSAGPTLVPDVPITDVISPVGDLDLFRFTLPSRQRVVLLATRTVTTISPCLRVLTGASGPTVPGGTILCGSNSARVDLVLDAGTYFVEVSDNFNDRTGDYTLLFQPIDAASAVPLVPDVPATGAITPVGDLDLYRFTLTARTRVVLQATRTDTTISPCLRLLTGASGPPVTGGTLLCGSTSARLDLTLDAGTYFVEVSDNFDDRTGGYTLLYQPIAVSSVPTPIARAQ
jgi:hypothetical protein